jgi:hypothetical protein
MVIIVVESSHAFIVKTNDWYRAVYSFVAYIIETNLVFPRFHVIILYVI